MKRLRVSPCLGFVLAVVVVGAGGYWLFGAGQSTPQRRSVNLPTAPPTRVLPTPIAPFPALNPDVTALLLADSPLAPRPLPLSAADIPPLGLYLPSFDQAGVLAFELRPEPALPPTDNRLLSANEDFPIISDAVSAAAIRAYGGEDCAPSGYPVSGLLTQRFYGYHTGIDIGVPIGTPVQATHSADVLFAGWNAYGYGFLVILQNGKYITYYAHLTNFNVQTGDRLGAGSIIGWSGSTGNSTGPHLHYETRIGDVAVDPLTFGTRGLDSC